MSEKERYGSMGKSEHQFGQLIIFNFKTLRHIYIPCCNVHISFDFSTRFPHGKPYPMIKLASALDFGPKAQNA